VWGKVGLVSLNKIWGNRLYLGEDKDVSASLVYSRTPTFINAIGSSVQWRMKIVKGTEKDVGNDEYTCKVVHSDGARKIEYLFYQNGVIFKLGSEYFKYHYDMTKYHTFKSHIKGDRLYFYIGRTVVFRSVLPASAVQEVSFGHYGRETYDTESRWGFVKYFHGSDDDPGFDIMREGWWLKTGEVWEPVTLYRKTGWTFTPEYHVPYFEVVNLLS